jgi:HK97 family phage portal protein
MGLFDFLKPKPSEKKIGFAGKYVPSGDFTFNRMGNLIERNKDWVYICANKNSLGVMKYPVQLYVARPNQDNPYSVQQRNITALQKYNLETTYGNHYTKSYFVDEITEHRFLDLLKKPNDYLTYEEVIYLTTMGLDLDGNAYWYLVRDRLGLPKKIHVLPPQYMTIGQRKNSENIEYLYNDGIYQYRIKPKNICHFKYPSYSNPNKGKAPISHLEQIFEIHLNMNKYENAIFKNMGELSGIFTTEENINKNEFERIKKEIKENFYGIKNAGKAPLLTKGLKYTNVSNSPKEMSYHEGRKIVRDMIAAAYDVPIAMLTADNVNKANAEAAYRAYSRDSLLPRMKIIAAKLSNIAREFDTKLFCAFENPDKEDRALLLEKQIKFVINGIKTRNEIRGEEGEKPIDGLDDPLTPINTQPLSAWRAEAGNTDGGNNE